MPTISRWNLIQEQQAIDEVLGGANTFTLGWNIVLTSGTEGDYDEIAIRNDSRFVHKGDVHPAAGFNAWCTRSSLRMVDPSRLKWLHTATYSDTIDPALAELPANPLDRPPRYRIYPLTYRRPYYVARQRVDVDVVSGSETVQSPVTQDGGVPVVNSVGFSFETQPERDDWRQVLAVEKNEPLDILSALATQETYQLATNSQEFLGAAVDTLLMSSITYDEMSEEGIDFFRVTYEMQYKPGGWFDEFRDEGFHAIVGGKRLPIKDDEKRLLVRPWPLNNSGVQLSNAQITANDYHGRRFYPYENQADFNALGLVR